MKAEDLAELENEVYDVGDSECADVLERLMLTIIKENGDLTNEVERLKAENERLSTPPNVVPMKMIDRERRD